MKEIITCRVIKYLNDAVKVKLSNGKKAVLPNTEISDISIPVDQKVYIGQTLTVRVEYTNCGLILEHKSLLQNHDEFFSEHLGDMVKARVVFSTKSGCMLEFAGNVHYFVKRMCNLQAGATVWASITMFGKVLIDSILYDEELRTYSSYEYRATKEYEHEEMALAA